MVNGASYKYTSELNGNIFFPREMFLADGDTPWRPMTMRRLATLHQMAGHGLPGLPTQVGSGNICKDREQGAFLQPHTPIAAAEHWLSPLNPGRHSLFLNMGQGRYSRRMVFILKNSTIDQDKLIRLAHARWLEAG